MFELKNAENSAGFKGLDLQVKTAQISPISYGKQKAATESQSTWNLATILKQLRAANVYTPSTFGQKQVDSTDGHDTETLYGSWFQDQPHEKDAHGRSGLPSWEFYACGGAQMLGGTTKNLNDVVTLKKTVGNRTTMWNLMANKLPGGNGISSMNDNSIKFYKAVIAVCAAPPAGFTVTWKSGAAADWKFTETMNAKTPDAGDWVTKIGQILSNSGQFNDVSKA